MASVVAPWPINSQPIQTLPEIDPLWVYVAPLTWHNAPRGIDSRWASAQVLVLYPDGQFAELDSTLMTSRSGKQQIHFSVGDGNLVRLGTWARTDDEVIRITSREWFRDPETVTRLVCKAPETGPSCTRIEEPLPGPEQVSTCGLDGHPQDALTNAIHCQKQAYTRLKLNLDLAYVAEMIRDAQLMRSAAAADPGTSSIQSPEKAAPFAPTLTFDVASVRENREPYVNGRMTMAGKFTPRTSVLRLLNFRIESLISYAYGVDEGQLAGEPDWPRPTVFVVEAKGDSEADAKMMQLNAAQQRAEQQHMLQVLLEERFKLKTHWETRQGDIYNLILAKGGPRLQVKTAPVSAADASQTAGTNPTPSLMQRNDLQGFDFVAHRCSVDELAETLGVQFGRPVRNQTGLTGAYDFVLTYKGRWDSDRGPDDPDPMLPMDRALEQDLGLKVVAAKGPVRWLVIDQIAKPSEN